MKLNRRQLRILIESTINEANFESPTPSNTANSVGKQKKWKKIENKEKRKSDLYFLARTSFGGGSGIVLASEKPFSAFDEKGQSYKAIKKDVIGYWKGSLPAYTFNCKLNSEGIAVISIDGNQLLGRIESKSDVFSIVYPS